MDAKGPSRIDLHVGRRIRWRRKELKLSQEALAERLGVTFQQVQKYERGANRISAGRLYELAQALGASIAYFYEGAEATGAALARGLDEDPADFLGLIDADAVDLVIAFHAIPDMALRRSILAMVKNSAAAFEDARGPNGGSTPADADTPDKS